MAKHIKLGKTGEQLAVKYLNNKGFEIIETNWRTKNAEIDVVALRFNKIHFIEVKTRSNDNFGLPEESVNFAKQKKIADAADEYINEKNIDLEVQFDIVAIIKNKKSYKIELIEEAFYPYEIN